MKDDRRDPRLIGLAVFALVAVGIVAAVLIGRSGGEDEETAAGGAAEGCEQAEVPGPKRVNLEAPPQTVERGQALTAVVETSCGSFEIDLDTERAPKTVNSFAFLAEEGVYDGTWFHRVSSDPQFGVIQGGDPSADGTGGPGYTVDERPPSDLAYTTGVVAMAKTGAEPPGRSGSQFFVVTSADLGLPPDYALLGEVSEGLEVVQRIGALGRPDETPRQPVLIDSVTIEEG